MNAAPESVAQASHRALQAMLRNIPKLKLFPCVKGYFYENMKQKLEQLASFRSNEIKAIAFDEIVKKINNLLPDNEDLNNRSVAGVSF
jgi:hypothetical protein